MSTFRSLITEIACKTNPWFDYPALNSGELLLRRIVVIFYCHQCMRRILPTSFTDRRQVFRSSMMLASFFAGVFEKIADSTVVRQGGEILDRLYLHYRSDPGEQKDSDSFIAATRLLLTLSFQFRSIETERRKRLKRRKVGSALLGLSIGRQDADKMILEALATAGTRLFSKNFRQTLRSRNRPKHQETQQDVLEVVAKFLMKLKQASPQISLPSNLALPYLVTTAHEALDSYDRSILKFILQIHFGLLLPHLTGELDRVTFKVRAYVKTLCKELKAQKRTAQLSLFDELNDADFFEILKRDGSKDPADVAICRLDAERVCQKAARLGKRHLDFAKARAGCDTLKETSDAIGVHRVYGHKLQNDIRKTLLPDY